MRGDSDDNASRKARFIRYLTKKTERQQCASLISSLLETGRNIVPSTDSPIE